MHNDSLLRGNRFAALSIEETIEDVDNEEDYKMKVDDENKENDHMDEKMENNDETKEINYKNIFKETQKVNINKSKNNKHLGIPELVNNQDDFNDIITIENDIIIIIMVLFYLFSRYYAVSKEISIQ